MAYRHLALSDPSQTRLLILHPAKDSSAALVGSLTEANIHIHPHCQYEALSYVWGAPSAAHTISICSSPLPITANCDTALRHLRLPSKERVLWVDSVCIDQTAAAVQERNRQVAMMGDIYQVATDVVVWLGEGDEKTDSFFLHLKRIYTIRDEFWDDARAKLCIRFANQCDVKWKTSKTAAIQDLIEDLLSRPWFERMWTLQELLLASRVTLMCGDQALGWDSFCSALGLIEAAFPLSSKGVRNFVNCFYACSDFQDLLASSSRQAPEPADDASSHRSLSTMFHHARIRHATDPRDKVFALYGLAQRIGKPLSSPDYTQPIPDVFARAAAAIIQHEKSLWPLDNVWSENRRHDLPSWVPDWSDDQRWFDDQFSELGGIPVDPADREILSRWKAPSGNGIFVKISPDYTQLTVHGQHIGVVEQVFADIDRAVAQHDVVAASRPSVEYELAMRKHGAEQIKFFSRIYNNIGGGEDSEARLQAFCRLLLTCSPTQPQSSFEKGSRNLHTLLVASERSVPSLETRQFILSTGREKLTQALDCNQRHHTILSFVESDIDAALDVLLSSDIDCGPEHELRSRPNEPGYGLIGPLASAIGFYKHIRGLSINKSVFTTRNGLMGYAHGRVCAGDIVVKFRGSPSTSVLRSRGDLYQLHSPAVIELSDEMADKIEASTMNEFTLI